MGKICTRCGDEKPATPEYFYRDAQTIDGLQYYCKVCKNDIHKAYLQTEEGRAKNREAVSRYWKTSKGKLCRKKHDSSDKTKAWRHARTRAAIEGAKEYIETLRLRGN